VSAVAARAYRTLFLCTGNSARSILAEAILRKHGGERFRAFSAGSRPAGRVHPVALEVLREYGHETEGLRSKSWDALAGPDAPALDFVFTVCDQAAGETCPVWPGQPMTAHWGMPDPAACAGPPGEQRAVFRRAYVELERRIDLLTQLPIEALDRLSLQHRLDAIGGSASRDPAPAAAGGAARGGGAGDPARPARDR